MIEIVKLFIELIKIIFNIISENLPIILSTLVTVYTMNQSYKKDKRNSLININNKKLKTLYLIVMIYEECEIYFNTWTVVEVYDPSNGIGLSDEYVKKVRKVVQRGVGTLDIETLKLFYKVYSLYRILKDKAIQDEHMWASEIKEIEHSNMLSPSPSIDRFFDDREFIKHVENKIL